MEHYAGIDVSLELSSVCIVDTQGKIVKEAKVASEPEAGDSTSSGPLQKAVYSQIRFRRRGSPNVRFAPQAPELFRHRKMTRWAMCGRLRVGKENLTSQAWSLRPFGHMHCSNTESPVKTNRAYLL